MSVPPARSADPQVRARDQLSSLYSLFVLSMAMFDRANEDEILRVALTAVTALGPCLPEAAYLVQGEEVVSPQLGLDPPDPALAGRLATLTRDAALDLPGRAWTWAYPLQSLGGRRGYLVVSAAAEPSEDQRFLLGVLAQQTGAALANAVLHRDQRAHAQALATLNDEMAAVNQRLTVTVADLERHTRIHEVLTAVTAAGTGEQGIATALHDLTGLPVAVEDAFGNLRAWAGPDQPAPYPKARARRRSQLLQEARRTARPVREGDRLLALAQPRDVVLGVLALVDPGRTAGVHDVFALEYAATVLAVELAHLRGLAEVELRLRGDLVHDLVSGTDDESAFARAEALGHDLHRAHRVVAVQWLGRARDDAVAQAIERVASDLELGGLLAERSGILLLLTHSSPTGEDVDRWTTLYQAVAGRLRSSAGAIGVGGLVRTPADFPRSYSEALRALAIRQGSPVPDGVSVFDDLGIYRMLAVGDRAGEVEPFVQEWLGPLLDYDAKHGAELVRTLSLYLECGGNYDLTAETLVIHRSTLRYRLQRIRDVARLDLNDVDARLNLHVATRAWRVLNGR